MPERETIALLGTGIMGAAMGRNLLAAGFPVRAWNRTATRAAPLAEAGATVASSPAEAAGGAGIVLTMLADGPAVEAVMTGPPGPLRPPARLTRASASDLRFGREVAMIRQERPVGEIRGDVERCRTRGTSP